MEVSYEFPCHFSRKSTSFKFLSKSTSFKFWAKNFVIWYLCGFFTSRLIFLCGITEHIRITQDVIACLFHLVNLCIFLFTYKINKQTDKALETLHRSKLLTLSVTPDSGLIITYGKYHIGFFTPTKLFQEHTWQEHTVKCTAQISTHNLAQSFGQFS